MTAGVPLESIALARIDNEWLYLGDDNYQGLLKENEAFERGTEVRAWISEAYAVVGSIRSRRSAPALSALILTSAISKPTVRAGSRRRRILLSGCRD